MPFAKQVLEIKILSCGGMLEGMSDMEADFLVNSLGLYRNRMAIGRGTPRANVSLARAYRPDDFYRASSGGDDILHHIGHADDTTLETGNASRRVTAAEVKQRADRGVFSTAKVVVSTACEFQSDAWREALSATGAEILIAASQSVTPANLVAFDMSFYSALLSQVRIGHSTSDRVRESFSLADAHYRAIHARGTPFAKFKLLDLTT